MSSESDQHSSSSPARDKNIPRRHSERSRSRDKYETQRTDQKQSEYRKAKIRIPELSSDLLSFKAFLQSQVERINPEQAQRAYDKYKKDWDDKQSQIFLDKYRDDAWFREKYDPEFLDAIQTERKQNAKKNHTQFLAAFQKGDFKNIQLSVKQPTSLGYVLPNDRFEDQEDSNNLIGSQTIDVSLAQGLDITKEPYFGFDPDFRTLFAKNVPKSISRFDIYEIARQLKGFKNITVSEPVKKNEFSRYCWIEFTDDQSFMEADLALSGIIIKDVKLSFGKSISKMKKAKILKKYPESRISTDVVTAEKIAQKLDKECGINENQIYNFSFESQKKKFDTLLLYLRKVHAFDYWTSTSFENQRLMSWKLGSVFLRVDVDYKEIQGIQTVFKKINEINEAKAAQQTTVADYLALLRIQIEKYVRETEKIGKDQVKQVWKCSLCDKKFKTCEFLAKHIIVKHPEIKDRKVKYLMDQAYLKDPSKITLSSLRDDRDSFRGRRPYNPNFRRGGPPRRENYKDFDEPQGEKQTKAIVKPLINYLDI